MATDGVRLLPCVRMKRALGALAFLAAMSMGVRATAAQYPGWADTGWVHTSRRECCNSEIAIAIDHGAQACVNSCGVPLPVGLRVETGTRRPNCDRNAGDWMLDTQMTTYRTPS